MEPFHCALITTSTAALSFFVMPPHANLKVEAQMKSCEELEPTWILPGDNTSGDAALDWAKSLKRDKDRIIGEC